MLDLKSSNKQKIFKDPVYGYICVNDDFINTFVDTSAFQRLRRIIQTSYTPLYPAASHNRFLHSLGVYHLGCLAFDSMEKSLDDVIKNYNVKNFNLKDYQELFLAACLLHDIGHAPFSHIGEEFFESNDKVWLDNQFWEAVGVDEKSRNVPPDKKASPHELMSVIIALQVFHDFFNKRDKEFFARCITGYKYTIPAEHETNNFFIAQLKNSLISVLNADLIDVDRLDYLIRDSFVSGYQNVSIDYNRLLGGLMVVYSEEQHVLFTVFHKNAISVIDNAIFAHDFVRKWIQNHPVICYEKKILQYAIKKLITNLDRNIFCCDALTEKGINIKSNRNIEGFVNEYKISLLSDIDILFFIKNIIPNDEFIKEYFDRTKRRRSIWKSEAEFTHLQGDGNLSGEKYKVIIRICDLMSDFFEGPLSGIPPVINQHSLLEAEKKLYELEHSQEELPFEDIDKQRLDKNKNGYFEFIKYCECFKKFAQNNKLNFEIGFLFLMPNKFKSNFDMKKINELRVYFPLAQKADQYNNISPILESKHTYKSKVENEIIYFYMERKGGIDIANLQSNFISFLSNELAINDINLENT